MLVSSTELSVAQQLFARVLSQPGLNPQKKITADQTQLLLSKVTEDERKDILDTRSKCYKEAMKYYGIPATALAIGSMMMFNARRPSMYYNLSGPMKCLYYAQYASAGCISFWGASEVGMYIKCKERVQPKVAQLWEKYGGAEWTANYEALSKGNQGGAETTSLVPVNKSMPVAILEKTTEKLANVYNFILGHSSANNETLSKEDPEEAQQRFARLLKSYGAPGINYPNKLTIAQQKFLLSRASENERKEILDTHRKCKIEARLHYGIPFAVLYLGIWSHPRSKDVLFIRPKGILGYAIRGLLAFWAMSEVGETLMCDDRITPMITQLWKKYGRDYVAADLSPEDMIPLSSIPRAWVGPAEWERLEKKYGRNGLVPNIWPLYVDAEKNANVDDTNAQRVNYPDDTSTSPTPSLVSGTPSGAPRERLKKSGNQTKTNGDGDLRERPTVLWITLP